MSAELTVVPNDTPAAPVASQQIARRQPVADKILYAKALAASGMLPRQYQGNPANLLYAVEYAEMLGCHPLTAVTGIHVIDGKPSASAALISALVRKAGHRLRVTGNATSATAVIVRADDPDFTFEVTFTIQDAQAAGLTGKGVWKNYPASMLKARAITQCARDACEDALSGIHYTAEELGAEVDEDGIPAAGVVVIDQGSASPAADPWAAAETTPIVTTDAAWYDGWIERLNEQTHEDGFRVLWAEMLEKHQAGGLTDGDRVDLTEMFKAAARSLTEAERAQAAAPVTEEPQL